MYGEEQEGRMEKCRAAKESSSSGDELRWGKSGRGYMLEKPGSDKWEGRSGEEKARRRQDSSPELLQSFSSLSILQEFFSPNLLPSFSVPMTGELLFSI